MKEDGWPNKICDARNVLSSIPFQRTLTLNNIISPRLDSIENLFEKSYRSIPAFPTDYNV